MASADTETRAAGLLMAADLGFSSEVQGCDYGKCDNEVQARNEDVVKRYVSPLAEMAAGTKSGEVYGLALVSCALARRNSATSPFCDPLTHQRWAELAPNNVWPWLAMASESQHHGDVSGTEFAMNRAMAAGDWQTEMHSVPAYVSTHLPSDAYGLPLLGILASAVRLDAEAQAAGLNSIYKYCPEQQDGNLHQTCVKLSNNVLSKTNSILGLSMGISIAERTGMPAEALAPLRAEHDDAVSKFKDLGMATVNDPLTGCAGIEKPLKYFSLAAKVGERGALR